MDMRYLPAGALIVVSFAGCSRHSGEEERLGPMKDTVVTPRQTQDTTIVTTDTTVKVDTAVKRGQDTVPMDTTRQGSDNGRTQ
jgi:hypothetical protein